MAAFLDCTHLGVRRKEQWVYDNIIACSLENWLHQRRRRVLFPAQRLVRNPHMVMSRQRMKILYSGHVQGVGFRYAVKSAARGFEVTGTVRNLPDGRVELMVEGETPELEAFRRAIPEAGLSGLIRHEDVSWSEAGVGFRGFEIVQ